jgi:hypothetical protein
MSILKSLNGDPKEYNLCQNADYVTRSWSETKNSAAFVLNVSENIKCIK